MSGGTVWLHVLAFASGKIAEAVVLWPEAHASYTDAAFVLPALNTTLQPNIVHKPATYKGKAVASWVNERGVFKDRILILTPSGYR